MFDTSHDKAIQLTDDDAAISKLSCVNAGYYEDEFLHMFVKQYARRNPIINMGYYVRVSLMRRLISAFVKDRRDTRQIVILGAGSDTNGLWALRQFGVELRVFEIDFKRSISRKASVLHRNQDRLKSVFAEGGFQVGSRVGDEDDLLGTENFKLIGCDLRDPLEQLEKRLERAGLRREKPTLFIAECVLIYLTRSESDCVLSWIARGFPRATLGVYEQINGTDRFGRVMLENLSARGSPLLSIVDSEDKQEARYRATGFSEVRCDKICQLSQLIEKKNVEIIDELEELNLFQQHYCLTTAFSSSDSETIDILSSVYESNENNP